MPGLRCTSKPHPSDVELDDVHVCAALHSISFVDFTNVVGLVDACPILTALQMCFIIPGHASLSDS